MIRHLQHLALSVPDLEAGRRYYRAFGLEASERDVRQVQRAAVHSQFNLSRTRQTERILNALDCPHVTLLAHPTGRLIGEREPYDVDMLQVVRKAKAKDVCLEVNAHPQRLDLVDTYCRMCKDEGVRVVIYSDAHATQDFANLRYGVGQARRGWLGPDDVLNTRRLSKLLPLLRKGAAPGRRARATPAEAEV